MVKVLLLLSIASLNWELKVKKFKYIHKYDLSNILQSPSAKVRPKFNWYTIISTWFFVGFIPITPGTLGSLAAYPLYHWIVYHSFGMEDVLTRFWIAFLILFIVGWIAINKFQKETFTQDSSCVVIDEVLGMLFVFALCFDKAYACGRLLIKYTNISSVNTAFFIVFIIFRYFDIRKPFFIRTIDRGMKNSLGVIIDDLAAAFFTFLIIMIIYTILSQVL